MYASVSFPRVSKFMHPEGLPAVFVEDSNLTDSCEERESELKP